MQTADTIHTVTTIKFSFLIGSQHDKKDRKIMSLTLISSWSTGKSCAQTNNIY